MTIYAPCIILTGEREPTPVTPMGSYRLSDAERRADLLRQYLDPASR